MNKFLLSFFTGILCLFVQLNLNAQNVGIGTNAPNSSSILDVNSSTRGMLIPRLTTAQRNSILSPAAGLILFDTDKGCVMFFDGTSWRSMSFTDESKVDPQSRSTTQPTANSNFGAAVAISGNYAIVGAPSYGTNIGLSVGVAFIFNKTSSGWKQVARLAAPDSSENANFGGSVAISGGYAIVGCCSKKLSANNAQGKAYIYRLNGSSWVLDTALVKPTGKAFDDFGWSVGICAYNTGGPSVAIGIPYSDVTGSDRGEVYCYKKTGSTWSFVQSIIPADLADGDYYGTTISMDTNYLAIAATAQDNVASSLTDAGAAYIYSFSGSTWSLQQKLLGTTARGQFGFALSLSSNKLAVGAPWATLYNYSSAPVYIYTRTGSTWTNNTSIYLYNYEVVPAAGQIQPVANASSISIANTTFGISLGLYGNTLLVGSAGGSVLPTGGGSYYSDRIGTVYIYKNLSGYSYTRVNTLQSDFPVTTDMYGTSVGISGSQYIIGSPKANVNAVINAGNVYFGWQ